MMTRATVEKILIRWRVATMSGPTENSFAFCPQLVNDLLALSPVPSREALEQILKWYFHPFDDTVMQNLQTQNQGVLIDKLMAWASGQLEREWCEDIRFDETSKHWVYLNTLHSAELWKFCPNCSAPRPKELSHA